MEKNLEFSRKRLNYFKKEEVPSECLGRIDKNNETSLSFHLTSTEVERVVIELKSV